MADLELKGDVVFLLCTHRTPKQCLKYSLVILQMDKPPVFKREAFLGRAEQSPLKSAFSVERGLRFPNSCPVSGGFVAFDTEQLGQDPF